MVKEERVQRVQVPAGGLHLARVHRRAILGLREFLELG
jgi:hypothetical protein